REPDNLQLNISPTLHHQAAAMLNVLRHYNWTDFSLVYTSDTGHDAFITATRLLVQDLNRQSGRKGF
ncbi:glutamate receptor ionotropic NMDA 2B isoform X8, partial [Biomphalaria pfeifferi]